MAIASPTARRSVVGFATVASLVLPVAQSEIDDSDRAHVSWAYLVSGVSGGPSLTRSVSLYPGVGHSASLDTGAGASASLRPGVGHSVELQP